MEDVIKTIIALDEKARRMVEDAENRRAVASQDVEKLKQNIKDEYDAKIKNAVDAERAKREQIEKKALAAFDSDNEEISARLDEQYRENTERWSEELVKRVIEE